MTNKKHINIQMIIQVAKRLGDLRNRVVFVGGCVTGLFITDPAMPEVRATQDVDVIVEVASQVEYYRLEEKLRGSLLNTDRNTRCLDNVFYLRAESGSLPAMFA